MTDRPGLARMTARLGVVLGLASCSGPRPAPPDPDPAEVRAGDRGAAGVRSRGTDSEVTDVGCRAPAGVRTRAELLAMPIACFTRLEDILAFWTLDKSTQFAPYASSFAATAAGHELISVARKRGPEGRAFFIEHIEAASNEVRSACIWGLASFADPIDIPVLVGRLNDVSPELRSAAISALASYGAHAPRDALRRVFVTELEWSPMATVVEALQGLGETDYVLDQLRTRLATPRRSEAIQTFRLVKHPPAASILLGELERNLNQRTGHEQVSTHLTKEVDGHLEGKWILTPSDNAQLVTALVDLKATAAIPAFQKLLALDQEHRGITGENIAYALHALTGKPVQYRDFNGDLKTYPAP